MKNAENNRRSTTPSPIRSLTLPLGEFDLIGVLDDDWASFIAGLESLGSAGPGDPIAGAFGAGFQPDDEVMDASADSAIKEAGASLPASGSAHNSLAPHHLPATNVTVNISCEEEVLDSCQRNCNDSHAILKSGYPEQGHVHRLCKRPRKTGNAGGSDGADRKPASKKSDKALIKDERLQKRLEKNRKTAAQSRERKKQEMKEKSEEVQGLKDENTRLKNELEVQKRHAQLLREELASFTRGAKIGTADAASTEPAALISSTSLPSVHDTVMTMQRRSAPSSSSSQQLTDIWYVLAFSTSQTGLLSQSMRRRCPSLQPPARGLHQTSSTFPPSQTPLLSS